MMSEGFASELPWLWGGLLAYVLATLAALWALVKQKDSSGSGNTYLRLEKLALMLLVLGVLLLTFAIIQRWVRIGHGPWISLFEILLSQLWSLGVVFTLMYWRLSNLRPIAVISLPVLWILGSWILTQEPTASHFPATYYNNWKWAHIFFAKIFFSMLLIGLGIAGVMILRQTPKLAVWFQRMPSTEAIDRVAWRFIILALVFDSLMLISGAVWAQDAWGRYWAWDSLETSSFVTWIAMAVGLHLRLTYKIPYWVSGLMIVLIFILAFTTFLGTPYVSAAAHKGVI